MFRNDDGRSYVSLVEVGLLAGVMCYEDSALRFFFSGSVVDSVPLWENNALFSNAALFI